jgi:hypothetical protein
VEAFVLKNEAFVKIRYLKDIFREMGAFSN